MKWVVGKCFDCMVFEVKGKVHVGTGKSTQALAVIGGCDNVLRYECEHEREQTANEKGVYQSRAVDRRPFRTLRTADR